MRARPMGDAISDCARKVNTDLSKSSYYVFLFVRMSINLAVNIGTCTVHVVLNVV